MKEKTTKQVKKYAFNLILALTFIYLVGYSNL
jgi:hypothetical protein